MRGLDLLTKSVGLLATANTLKYSSFFANLVYAILIYIEDVLINKYMNYGHSYILLLDLFVRNAILVNAIWVIKPIKIGLMTGIECKVNKTTL